VTAGRVTLERDGPVGRIAFDRPETRNAMTSAMYDEFEGHLEAVGRDASLRAVVLRGAGGRAFVAGSDISDLARIRSGEEGLAYEARMDRILHALREVPAPTVAMIEGLAVGGGLNIAAACDLRTAEELAPTGLFARVVPSGKTEAALGEVVGRLFQRPPPDAAGRQGGARAARGRPGRAGRRPDPAGLRQCGPSRGHGRLP
jgi:1,4-dihydroxy-2-naphthoyl-CoA synthase